VISPTGARHHEATLARAEIGIDDVAGLWAPIEDRSRSVLASPGKWVTHGNPFPLTTILAEPI